MPAAEDATARAKAAIRAAAREARAALSPGRRADDSRRIAERALALPEVAESRAVLAYGATPEEADPAPLLAELRAGGARVALPRVDGSRLTLHWVADDGELERGAFGLRQPREDAPIAEKRDLDLVIVPGVAFDAGGRRLGYGGGYYDRLLPALVGVPKVALAFDEQVVETIPAEEHDVPVDVVVTPTRVLGERA